MSPVRLIVLAALALGGCQDWPPPGFDGGDAGLSSVDGALAGAHAAVGEAVTVKVTVGR